MKKIILTLMSLTILCVSVNAKDNVFTETQIDKMINKLNYTEHEKVEIDIQDPFLYPQAPIVEQIKAPSFAAAVIEKKKEKIVQTERIVIDYQGMIIDKARINSKTYKIGDFFQNTAKIISISTSKISLDQNGFVFEVLKNKNSIIIKEIK